MPEIWLNYGVTQVVLDIRAENLHQKIDSDSDVSTDDTINEKLATLDLTKPIELVITHDSRSVRKIISSLFTICEQKSLTPPKILADRNVMNQIKSGLPENSIINEFTELNSNLVFVGEIEFDGLFGYETISTRLIRRFGQEYMLSAFAKRKSNTPIPGQMSESFKEATKFADNFDIQAIELVSNSSGIIDFVIDHPSKTSSITKVLESSAIKDIGKQKSMIISTGKSASNDTLSKSLHSLWSCSSAIKNGGLVILLAECQRGLGSDALQLHLEGRLPFERLRNPTKYVDGMENLLFLHEMRDNFQLGLVSTLPEFYVKNLNMIPLSGVKQSLDYIMKTQGSRQKVVVVSDGARLLLR